MSGPKRDTLAVRLRDAPLDPKQTVALMAPIVDALESARRSGRPPSRLAPATIVLTPHVSFTGAAGPAPAGRSSDAIESADYRAPEEIRGERPTSASNVYSLGCIVMTCVTGEPPFPYDRPLLTLHGHLVEPPRPPSARVPGLPTALDEVVMKALAKNPRERHSSPADLIRSLARAAGVEPARAVAPVGAMKPAAGAVAAKQGVAAGTVAKRSVAAGAVERKRDVGASETVETKRVSRRDAGGRRGSRWAGVRRLTPTLVGAALLASAVAGFTVGGSSADDGGDAPSSQPSAAVRPAAVSPTVAPVMARLDERRTRLRRRLRDAGRTGEQAALATRLAHVYASARHAVVQAPDQPGTTAALADRLRAIERTYAGMASAARHGSKRAWHDAGAAVADRERDLELLLRTGRWT